MQTLKLTKKYEKYSEYKDSRVEWLGKIPKEWQVRKIKSFSKTIAGGTPATDNILYWENGTIPWLPSGMVHDNVIFENTKGKYITELGLKKSAAKIIPDNSVLLALTGATCGNIAYLTFQATANQSVVAVVNNKRNSLAKYIFYILLANREQILVKRTGGAQSGINEQDVKNLHVSFPDLEDQKKISKYLDQKTGMIDQIIEKKQKQIELLDEKRTAVINHAVNDIKGATEKLKYIAPERKIKLDKVIEDTEYIGLENIESGTGKIVESPEKTEPESSVNIFKEGDVLFGKLRPYLAKVFSPDFDGVCSGEFLTLVPKSTKILSKFLFYKLISEDFIKTVNDSTYGTKMPRANWQFIGNQFIKFPSISEQQKIIDLLDSKTELFGKLIKQVEKSIETLQEFKSSLISNVVTGKIKI